MNEASQDPEMQKEPSAPAKSTVTRRAVLKAGWIAPVILSVPLMGMGQGGHIPPHGSGYPGSKDHGSKDYGSKDYGSKDWDKGSKDWDHGSKDYGKGSKDYGKGSKDYGKGSKDYSKGSKDYSKGSKDYGKGSKEYSSKDHGSGGNWWDEWIKWN
jgi:hypothetical protein